MKGRALEQRPSLILNLFDFLIFVDFQIRHLKRSRNSENMDKKGKGLLVIRKGPVHAGKTMGTLGRIYERAHGNEDKKIIVVNHENDTRGGKKTLSTHNPNTDMDEHFRLMPQVVTKKCKSLTEIDEEVNDANSIFIEESQFFDHEESMELILKWVYDMHKYVECIGLDLNFKGQPFANGLDLNKLSIYTHPDNVLTITAVCERCKDFCKKELKNSNGSMQRTALFSAKVSGRIDGSDVDVENSVYVPMCIYHFMDHLKETDSEAYKSFRVIKH